MDEDSDEALLERFRQGDRGAFTELVIRYQRPIYNASYWVVRKAEDANDVAQIVFLKVMERIDDYDPRYKFFSWIYRIAVNESLNLLRRNGRTDEFDEELDVAGPEHDTPEARLGELEISSRIRSTLMTMSTNDRTVIMLRHFSECSYEEIGQILELDEKTVKSRLFEARQRLRELLKDLRVH
ncbi:MAG: sigma-70 family RNA polymerase sigma factor [Caldimonas sp.]